MPAILSVEQIRKADQFTVEHEPIESVDLMERAALVFCEWFKSLFHPSSKVIFVCGIGNNGGDGLVAARLLYRSGIDTEVWVVRYSDKTSGDFAINYDRLRQYPQIALKDIYSSEDLPDTSPDAILVDALWGSGLSRPIEGFGADVIRKINEYPNLKVAIDIPSGLFADQHSDPDTTILMADFSFSFERPKLAFFMPENYNYVGEWAYASIGLHPDFLDAQPGIANFTDSHEMGHLLQARMKFDHKGNFGHALLIGGNDGKYGAVQMASRACLHSGAGLTTAHIPNNSLSILQSSVPELMCTLDRSDDHWTIVPDLSPYAAIGIGPGLGTHTASVAALSDLLDICKTPLVLDADALNILASNKDLLKKLPPDTILTPHPGEFKRLAGDSKNDFDRLQKTLDLAAEYEVIVVLKGAHTLTVLPDGSYWFNTSGNPGMASGGSGDVLTGLITGLLAQGYPAPFAAILGVYWHGLAGDIAAQEKNEPSIIAGDIISHLSTAWTEMELSNLSDH